MKICKLPLYLIHDALIIEGMNTVVLQHYLYSIHFFDNLQSFYVVIIWMLRCCFPVELGVWYELVCGVEYDFHQYRLMVWCCSVHSPK